MAHEVLKLSRWETPASKYPRKNLGKARIATHFMTPGNYECYGFKGYRYYKATRRLRTTNLRIDGKTWMTDDFPHWTAMEEHALAYSGHVVCAGLGLGLIVHTLATNPKVKKITVIEREADVIKLVRPLVPACEIVHADFYKWLKPNHPEVDGIFYDLLVGNGPELVAPMLRAYFELRDLVPRAVVRVHGAQQHMLERIYQEVHAIKDVMCRYL